MGDGEGEGAGGGDVDCLAAGDFGVLLDWDLIRIFFFLFEWF